MKKGIKITSLACTAALLLSSVLSPASTVVQAKAKKPALSRKKLSIKIGKTAKLSVKRAKGWKISWKSKNKKIATAKKSGKYAVKITAKKKGTVTITATLKKGKTRRTLSCKVTVSSIKNMAPIPNTPVPPAPSANTATQAPNNPDVPQNTPTSTPSEGTPGEPTSTPVGDTSGEPTSTPTATATAVPDVTPSTEPTIAPSASPTMSPTEEPTTKPTIEPTTVPSAQPTSSPTAAPTAKPSAPPSPSVTPQPSTTPAVTDKPLVTMAPEASMVFSKDTFMASGAADEPVYNADGSVTVTLKKQYGGGGIGFYMDPSKSMVDLSDYTKVIFHLSADAEAPICLRTHDTADYWGANSSTTLSFTDITTEQKEYICDLSAINSTLGFGVKYNPGGSADLPEEINLTIHSISFIKDTRDITDAMENYTSLAEMGAAYGLKMGTVMNGRKVADKKYGDLMKYHFNSITAANEMKAYSMLDLSKTKEAYTDENSMPVLNFTGADAIMDFAKANNIKVRGHALVWDAGMLDWFFREGYDSTKPYATTEVVKTRLQNYIEQVLVHFEEKYPGVIYCWDVVNEAVGDSDTEYEEGDERHVRTKRNNEDNPFYTLIGRDYVELSFQYTHEVLEELKKTMPTLDIKLYYNDYSTFFASKRDAIYNLVSSVNSFLRDDKGGYVKLCDGVGMQSYIGGYGQQAGCMNENDIEMVKTAILKFASLGIEVQVTELAVRNYENDAETLALHGEYYKKLFQAYLEINSGEEKPLKAISIWGIIDEPDLKPTDYSFKMNGPYCGLFNEKLAVKDAFKNVHDLLKNGQ